MTRIISIESILSLSIKLSWSLESKPVSFTAILQEAAYLEKGLIERMLTVLSTSDAHFKGGIR